MTGGRLSPGWPDGHGVERAQRDTAGALPAGAAEHTGCTAYNER